MKTDLIQQVKELLNPDGRAPLAIFRKTVRDHEQKDTFAYQGRELTRRECERVRAQQRIFITRRIVTSAEHARQPTG